MLFTIGWGVLDTECTGSPWTIPAGPAKINSVLLQALVERKFILHEVELHVGVHALLHGSFNNSVFFFYFHFFLVASIGLLTKNHLQSIFPTGEGNRKKWIQHAILLSSICGQKYRFNVDRESKMSDYHRHY